MSMPVLVSMTVSIYVSISVSISVCMYVCVGGPGRLASRLMTEVLDASCMYEGFFLFPFFFFLFSFSFFLLRSACGLTPPAPEASW